jgi:exodeoxyribonuclease V beta subunit
MNPTNYPLRHHFIEASAGTGKTYTIMEIVTQLIENENLDLKKTLILTFTEKAAGELKERLRRKLADSENYELRKKVYELDEVVVTTIHGFCISILEEYPVETGYSDLAVFKDGPTRGMEALYQLEHSEWKGYWGEELPFRLRSSQYFEKKDKYITKSLEKLLSGREYENPDLSKISEELKIPRLQAELLEGFFEKFTKIETFILDNVTPSFYKSQRVLLETSFQWFAEWRTYFSNTKLNFNSSDQIIKYLSNFEISNIKLQFNSESFQKSNKSFNEEEKIKILDQLKELDDEFQKTFGEVKEYLNPKFFLQQTILQAFQIANSDSGEEWISFDAMISRLADSLEQNSILLESLRRRFDVGIIDEFQDTDSLQYSIFQKIFLYSDSKGPTPKKALYLIGDPKQSIYGFRGADIGTYLQAKKDIQTQLGDEPIGFTLDKNYRSVENLILGYNEIFKSDHFLAKITEAGYDEDPIIYSEVSPPDKGDRNYDLDPGFADPPIQVVDFAGADSNSISILRDLWTQYIIQEIHSLINFGFRYKKKIKIDNTNDEIHSVELKYSDIAILVNSKKTGISLLEECKKAGIPATYYQQDGIYQSREVDQILTILTCLQDSHNPSSFRKILLTDAFRIHPKDLNLFEEHSIDSYEKRLLNLWRISADKRRFADLFRSIEQDSKIFFVDSKFDLSWERKTTNYRQIFRKLLEISQNGKPTLVEIILELKKLKNVSKIQEEKALFEKETESSAVQILTVHASKGLEWPVVFLHSMVGRHSSMYEFYDYPTVCSINGKDKRVWKISFWEENKDAFDAYEKNEAKRKFYVAITRPKIRLYLPLTPLIDKENTLKSNSYSEIISSSLIEIQKRIRRGESELGNYFQFRDFLEDKDNWKTNSSNPNSRNEETYFYQSIAKPTSLIYPLRKIHKSIAITSYSSLKDWDNTDLVLPAIPYGSSALVSADLDHKIKDDDQLNTEESEAETLIQPGAFAGNYLHNILENLSFEKFAELSKEELAQDPELRNEIFQWMDYYGIDKTKIARAYQGNDPVREAILRETIEILWNTMHANIPLSSGDKILLKDINDSNTVREMSFHWNSQFSPDMEKFLTTQLIKGSIDLVFEWEGKYYLADYKSNSLDKNDDVNQKVENDEASRYDLQRDIYSYVFFKYLEQCFGDQNSALEKFGGIYYFFLRAMEAGKDTGIYSDVDRNNWNLDRFQTIETRIQSVLENWGNSHEN